MQHGRKLATKIGFIISGMLVIVFAIFITVTVWQAKLGLDNATIGELQATAKANGEIIQPILDAAVTVTDDMNFYLQTYLQQDETAEDETEEESFRQSVAIPNLKLSEKSHEIENYLLFTAAAAVENNDNVTGVGVYFEPYALDPNVESYGIYADYSTGKLLITSQGDYTDYTKLDYYINAIEAKDAVFSDPYVDSESGVQMVTASAPILVNGQLKGVVFVDISIARFDEINVKNEQYATLRYSIVSDNGIIAYHSTRSDLVGSGLEATYQNPSDTEIAASKIDAGEAFYTENKDSAGADVFKFFYPIKAGSGTWAVANTIDAADVNKVAKNTTILLIVLAVIALAVIVTATVLLLRKMLKPIEKVVAAAEEISKGNLDIDIQADSNDEIGLLADTFRNTATTLKEIIEDVSYLLGEMGNGNFAVKSKDDGLYVGAFTKMLEAIRAINHNLSNTLTSINQASEQVSTGSDQVSSGAQALSQGATEQASAVEELAATINDISSQVKNNAENAVQASRSAKAVGDEIMRSNEKMQDMTVAMQEIRESSSEIGKIIKAIEDIAFQTNILALNAAVEAARAGVAGKGFAVVAGEVRNLASKSTAASKDTTALIESSINAVEKGTQIADETAQQLIGVVEGAKNIVATIDVIAEASRVQSESISQVTQGIDQISSVVQTNSATAEESAALSEELSGQAQVLKNLVGKFRLE